MIKTIKQNKYFIFTFISILCAIGWFLNFNIWCINWLYFLFFIFYFLINSIWLGKILAKLLNLERELQLLFGLFCLLFLIAFGMAVPIFFYRIMPIYLLGLLIFLTIVISFMTRIITTDTEISFENLENNSDIRISKIFYFLFFIFYFLALILLFRSRTGNFILSPWDVIKPYYLYLWFGVAFMTGLFIFSKEKIWKILLIIILASLLLHAYLPVIYQTGFGGDKWRHLGAERWLMEGKIYSPALFGKSIQWKQVGPIKIPEIFIVGNKNSYVNMWGLSIALSWLLNVDVFWIDLFLGYLIYSIFLPLLLFKLGQFFTRRKSILLLFAFLPLIFSPFQTYGSITIPNSFGFIYFTFVIIFIFNSLFLNGSQNKNFYDNKSLFWTTLVLILFCYFNYILYFLLILEIVFLAWLIKKINKASVSFQKTGLIVGLLFITILFLLIIPLADTVNAYSHFKEFPDIIENFGQNLLNFGQKLITSQAIFIRLAGVEQDNWLFSQIDQNLNRSALLQILPWHLIITPILWLIVFYGICKFRYLKHKSLGFLIVFLLFIVLVNQFIASYFMEGNHIFSKRLVIITAFLFLITLAWGVERLVFDNQVFSLKAKIIACILILSFASTVVYASGPKMQTVTAHELTAAKYLWNKIKQESRIQSASSAGRYPESSIQNYCVLANTWPLLALEAESGREIVAGGFPFYYEYRQPERVQLFNNMNRDPSLRDMERALEVTKARNCYFMTEEKWIPFYQRDKIIERLNVILGQPEKIGDVYLWHYQK